jgi:polysaccharide biosynthesis transport protein
MSYPTDNPEIERYEIEPEVDYRRYLYALVRHYRLIVIFTIVSAGFALVRLRSQIDVYTSTAQIMVQNESYTLGRNPYFRMPNTIDPDMIRLWMLSSPVMNKINSILGPEAQTNMLGYSINFPMRDQRDTSDTLLVIVSAKAREPSLAHRMADAMISAFRSQLMDNQLQKARESMSWMAEQLADQKKKVEEAEARFQEYKETIQVVSFEEQRNSESSRILKATAEMNDIKNLRMQLEVDYRKLADALAKNHDISDLTFKSQDIEPVTSLIRDYNTLQVQKQEKLKVFKSKHPEIIDLDSQMETLRSRIETEKNNVVSSFQIRLQTLRERENVLLQAIEDYKKSAQVISEKEWQYRILERELRTNEELYHGLLNELQGTDLRAKIESTTVTVVEPPFVPVAPDPRHSIRSLLKAILLGLAAGAIVALVLDFFETSIRSPEELEHRLGIPVVGVIPEKE